MEECIEILNGAGPADLLELCLELSAWMFVLGARTTTLDAGRDLAREMIATGRARDTFREVIRLQGGDAKVVDDPGRLPRAGHTTGVIAGKPGYVTAIRCEQVGVASMMLGGGREKKEDTVDPAVGLVIEKKIGDAVKVGETLLTVHYNNDARLADAVTLLEKCFEIGDRAAAPLPLVRKVIGG